MSGIERAGIVILLLMLGLAVFPMEQPGMLHPWLGIEPSVIFQSRFLKFTIPDILLGAGLAIALIYRQTRLGHAGYRNYFGGIFWLFLFCIIWGYLGTFAGGAQITAEYLSIAHWKRVIYGMMVFAIVTLLLDTGKKLQAALLAVVVTTLLLDAYGLIRYLFFGGLQVHHYISKVVFWETVKLSLNAFVVIYALGTLLLGDQRLRVWHRRLLQAALLAGLAVVFLSARRTSMVMVLTASAFYWLMLLRRGRVGLALGIVALGTMAVLVVGILNYEALETKFISRFESLAGVIDKSVEVDKGSTQGHLYDIVRGWNTVMEDPVWGVGFAWKESADAFGAGADQGTFWVHNSLLTFWIRFGIPGVITYLFLYYKILSVLWRAYRRHRDYLSATFLVWFTVEFMSGWFFPPFFGYFKMVALFFGTLALANVHLRVMSSAESSASQAAHKTVLQPGRVLQMRSRNIVPGASD